MSQPFRADAAAEHPGCIKAEGAYQDQIIPSKINEKDKLIVDESIRTAGTLPQHFPKNGATADPLASSLPPKAYGQQRPMHSNQPSSSARDTQITAPSGLFSGSLASSEKDEYLLRLLSKGVKPPAMRHNSTSLPGSSSGFRVPDPVPHRVQQLRAAAPPPLPPRPLGPHPGSSAPSVPQAPPAQDSAPVRPHHPRAPSQTPSSWSFSDTQRGMGKEAAAALRSAVISHQVAFLDQMYDFHRALAVQKLLVRHCPEVKEVMSQAEAILRASSSREDAPHRAAKRARNGDAGGEPSTESQEKLLHPDSQFAALPLSKDTATCDGSGDDGDGSGGNGSGGGSTSPQPQIITALPHGMVAMQPAPSGASQTPLGMFPWGGMQHSPMMMMHHGQQHPWAIGQQQQQQGGGLNGGINGGPMQQQQQQQYSGMAGMPGTGGPPHNGGGAGMAGGPPPMPPYGMMGGGDPLMWWYQDYYGRQAMAAQQGQGGAQQQMQQQQQAGAGLGPGGLLQMPSMQQQAPKWWQDPQQTFGPPADPEVIARAAAAVAAARRGPLGGDSAAAMEVESAPPSKGKVPSRSTATAVGAGTTAATAAAAAGVSPQTTAAAAAAVAVAAPSAGRSKSARLVAPPRRRHKRKPADPIAEASSGTSGQNHQLGPHAGLDEYAQDAEGGLHPAGADANVAKLLLAFSGQRADR